MDELKEHNLFIWRTTPDDLRNVAESLERQYREAALTDKLPCIEIFSATGAILRVTLDQDKMSRRR